jgi:tRNA A37 methylthiotransferase MiaB
VRIDLLDVWNGTAKAPDQDVDVVLLSTTYIWNRHTLAAAIDWISANLPGTPIVCGGQFTNLKYPLIMNDHPEVIAIIRGDGEAALPELLNSLGRRDLSAVPNAVWRDGDRIRINALQYVDLDAFPSPTFSAGNPIVPYESMRGCPFDCKFCSFPAASPKWRYKSAEKIRDDWVAYAHQDATSIEAMDSTFTVPPTRLRRLMELLPDAHVPWECYSRANVVDSAEFIDRLLAAHCFRLQIGFESMNEQTLRRMSKRVTARQNRRAFELLRAGDLGYDIFFMVGYPGEGPEEFEDTRRFLVDEYAGHFMLHLFSITDETMPLWADREELAITVDDPHNTDSPWSHIGMNSHDARRLQAETLDEVRRRNSDAVLMLWQGDYQHALMPGHDNHTNLAVEKALELLAMAPRDFADHDRGAADMVLRLDQLRCLGVEPRHERELCLDPI